jgi:hypothetical protein
MPQTDEETVHAAKEACFYEYFVSDCLAYLTHNINLSANLAN